MTTPRRRGRPGLDLETVIKKSVTIFNERGFDGTSMDDLARRLGITKSAIYHHVTSKDALLGLALDRALSELEAAAEQARTMPGPAVDRLESLLRRSVEVLVEHLPEVTLLLHVHGNSEVERDALERRRRIDRLAAQLVEEAVAAGDLRPDLDAALTSRLVFGVVNSLTEWLRPTGRHPVPVIADAVIATAVEGLRVH